MRGGVPLVAFRSCGLACLVMLSMVAVGAGDCRIVWSLPVPEQELSGGVAIGGLSDLTPASGEPLGTALWTLTDRGPNGSLQRRGKKVRTLLTPEFVPSLVLLRIAGDEARSLSIERTVPLVAANGKPLSGRPLAGRDDPVFDADGAAEVPCDPGGVDPEAVVSMADGTFWIGEEYGPSLLHVAADGRVLGRFIPDGAPAAKNGAEVVRSLPAVYGRRRENRGFEALAAARDGSRLWALLQSPLDNPGPKAGRKTGNVRLLAFDPRQGRPVAEHVYRLGDPMKEGYLRGNAVPDDGKLCAMAALDDTTLLVLEQDDDGLARLYVVSLTGATNTLGGKPSAAGESAAVELEEVRDLAAAGISPLRKTLAADLASLRRTMKKQADGDEKQGGPLKLEGLAVVDGRHVLVIDDNDFGVAGGDRRSRATMLWMVELERPLPGF